MFGGMIDGIVLCVAAVDKNLGGPYYLWTRKVAAKTVTVRLTAEEARRCMQWSRNMRRFDRLVRELQQLGLHAADALRGSAPLD